LSAIWQAGTTTLASVAPNPQPDHVRDSSEAPEITPEWPLRCVLQHRHNLVPGVRSALASEMFRLATIPDIHFTGGAHTGNQVGGGAVNARNGHPADLRRFRTAHERGQVGGFGADTGQLVVPACKSRTNTSAMPFTSPVTRLLAALTNATIVRPGMTDHAKRHWQTPVGADTDQQIGAVDHIADKHVRHFVGVARNQSLALLSINCILAVGREPGGE